MRIRRSSLLGISFGFSSLAVLAIGACVGDAPDTGPGGSDGSTADVASGDGSSGDSASGDSAPPGPCNLSKPFGAPTPVGGLGDVGSVARFSPDERIAYFATFANDGAAVVLEEASRASRTDAFGPSQTIVGVDGPLTGRHPSVSTNGNTIYWDLVPDAGALADIYRASRANPDASFGAASAVPGVNIYGVQDEEPFLAVSGDLWLASQRDSVGTDQLYVATNTGGGTLGTPATRADLNSATNSDQYPVMSADGLTIYFSRTGPDTQNVHQVMTATRGTPSGVFPAPVVVTEVNESGVDVRPAWLSPDGCRLYVAKGPAGAPFAIWVAEKPAP